jgi:hypothetical protein
LEEAKVDIDEETLVFATCLRQTRTNTGNQPDANRMIYLLIRQVFERRLSSVITIVYVSPHLLQDEDERLTALKTTLELN